MIDVSLLDSVTYIEIGTCEQRAGFWPHKCDDACIYWQRVSKTCALGCSHYQGLNLIDFLREWKGDHE